MLLPFAKDQTMAHPEVTPPTPQFRDEVPRGPVPAPITPTQQQMVSVVTEPELAALHQAANVVREAARHIEVATRGLQQVANSSTIKLTRRDKIVVSMTALGLVGVGVGATLAVQRVSRNRANRRAMTITAK